MSVELVVTDIGRGGKSAGTSGWLGRIAMGLLFVLCAVAVLAPVLAPYDPLRQDLMAVLQGPSWAHLLGTDQIGRDVLSRLIWGSRVALVGVAEVVVTATLIGGILGLAAGYVGGWKEGILSRVFDIIQAIPAVVVLLMVFSLSSNNNDIGMVTLGIMMSPTIYRVARSAAVAERQQDFVRSARISGVLSPLIALRHVMPGVLSPVVINASVLGGITLGIQAGINYMGLGVTPPTPSWGGMVSEAQANLQRQPWLLATSGLLLALTIAVFVIIGDHLQDRAHAGRRRSKQRSAPDRDRSAVVSEPLPSSDGAIVTLDDVCVRFGGIAVVEHVHLDLMPGRALGLMGESGSGKTVSIGALLGLIDEEAGGAVSGSIVLNGQEISGLSEEKRRALMRGLVGYVPQEPMVSLDPCFTVGRQLEEFIALDKTVPPSGRRARVQELLGLVGISEPERVAQQYPHQISGGMAQRVCIAIALAGRPDVLIADEPTTALDVSVQAEILDVLRGLQGLGLAIMIVSHDPGVIADLCDDVAVMYAGEVVELGSTVDVLTCPKHPYTRGLIAANPTMQSDGLPQPIAGTVPAPVDWPEGCHFADRCPLVMDECRAGPVPASQVETGRLTRCIRVKDSTMQEEDK